MIVKRNMDEIISVAFVFSTNKTIHRILQKLPMINQGPIAVTRAPDVSDLRALTNEPESSFLCKPCHTQKPANKV